MQSFGKPGNRPNGHIGVAIEEAMCSELEAPFLIWSEYPPPEYGWTSSNRRQDKRREQNLVLAPTFCRPKPKAQSRETPPQEDIFQKPCCTPRSTPLVPQPDNDACLRIR
jgi:hypothetical protein